MWRHRRFSPYNLRCSYSDYSISRLQPRTSGQALVISKQSERIAQLALVQWWLEKRRLTLATGSRPGPVLASSAAADGGRIPSLCSAKTAWAKRRRHGYSRLPGSGAERGEAGRDGRTQHGRGYYAPPRWFWTACWATPRCRSPWASRASALRRTITAGGTFWAGAARSCSALPALD